MTRIQRRRAPARISARQQARLRAYARARAAYLSRPENRQCRVFPNRRATEIHHARGRAGRLLLDERFWVPVSRAGHRWIHDHPEAARRAGLLGPWLQP